MMSKTLSFLGLSAAFLVVGIQAAVLPDISKLSPGDSLGGTFPSSLRVIGTVDGKSFLAENTPGMNWTEAKTYCNSFGLKLASIKSSEEAALLSDAFSSSFAGFFWTSGRDALELRQFSWDSDRTEPNASFVDLVGGVGGIKTALQYLSVAGTSQVRYYTTSDNQAGALCEF